MLKLSIDKATFDALADPVKEQYKQVGVTDEFKLDLDGYSDPAELRRALERVRQEAKDAKEAADLLREEANARETGNAKKRGDIDALEKSWKEKYDKLEADRKKDNEKAQAQLRRLLVDNKAAELAAQISVSPNLLLPHLKARLDVDFAGDEPITRVLGVDGKPSALTLNELSQEFVANKEFAAIIRASNASGGGAAGNQGGGATKAFKDMGDAERKELLRTDPTRFNREVAAQQAAAKT